MICALLGAIIWNLITWWFGLPSSSSHALIGGLCGAALAASNNNWQVIIWSQPNPQHWYHGKGLLWKVIVPMFTSPIAGLILGFIVMALLYLLLATGSPDPGQSLLWPGANGERRGNGLHARHQRRAEDDGHYRPHPARRHQGRAVGKPARLARRSCTPRSRSPASKWKSRCGSKSSVR